MKKIFLFCSIFIYADLNAQDSDKPIPSNSDKVSSHELGVNATLLLKQIFSLSNNNFVTLPYNLTYKYIKNTWALRSGIGLSLDNSKRESSTASTDPTAVVTPGPDQAVPTTNNSYALFYRLGWEYRGTVNSRIMAFAGFDLAGEFARSNSQSSSEFNNLPASYQFIKTTNKLSRTAIGGGPVVGMQFFITKHLSLFTEMPLYFQLITEKEDTENYRNVGSGSSFSATTDINTEKISESKLTLILPVTIYLAWKF